MEIKKAGAQPSGRGPTEYFTGAVRIDPLFAPTDPGRAGGASVTFEPGARTAWQTHPLARASNGWNTSVTSTIAHESMRRRRQ